MKTAVLILMVATLTGCWTFGVEEHTVILTETIDAGDATLLKVTDFNTRFNINIRPVAQGQPTRAVVKVQVFDAWRVPEEADDEISLQWKREGESIQPSLELGKLNRELAIVNRATIETSTPDLFFDGGCDEMIVEGLRGEVEIKAHHCNVTLDTQGPVNVLVVEPGTITASLRASAVLNADDGRLTAYLLPDQVGAVTLTVRNDAMYVYIDRHSGYSFQINTQDSGFFPKIIEEVPEVLMGRNLEESFNFQGGGSVITINASNESTVYIKYMDELN